MKLLQLTLVCAASFLFSCQDSFKESEEGAPSGAGIALDAWSGVRFNQDEASISSERLLDAYNTGKRFLRTADKASWKSIGPKNIGGRTLCLAFHPFDADIIYAGSASGGLWKTYSSGIGYNGWVQIPIDLPVYSIASILISPKDPDIIFCGTGEVYNKNYSTPGIVNRTTRGTYGIGIIKSTDGGKKWTNCLKFSPSVISGVSMLKFDPYDDQIIYAATTQGLYKSTNQGGSWTLIHDVPMAIDVDINLKNPEIIYVTHGSYKDNAISGIYRSNNSGNTFVKLKNGLPDSYSGKAMLDISKSNPNIIYTSVADDMKSIGLFMSVDAGDTWDRMNNKDVANVQGWYSHDIAIDPENPDVISYVGQNGYISVHKGKDFEFISSWDAGDMGRVPVGGAESIYDIYIHADIHATYFHPLRPSEIYYATDGGIFVTRNRGLSFEGRNGGYQTTQFYANFSASRMDSKFAIGGMQDNGTALYDGQDGWIKVIGGDGMSTAITGPNENIIFGTYQYFGFNISTDKGKTFDFVRPFNNALQAEEKAFNTPYEVIPSAPNSIYVGAQRVYLNERNGDPSSWRALHSNPLDENAAILALGISPTDPTTLLASTFPLEGKVSIPKLFRSTNGGASWQQVTGLPGRAVMDISFDPVNGQIVYISMSGFGKDSHVYKSMDAGSTWQNIDNGLPDVPTNCITINPKRNNELYVGNDLGVYFSSNSGRTWEKFMEGLPNVVMAMSISITAAADKIKVATHGNGVYESPLAEPVANRDIQNPNVQTFTVSPNPANGYIIAQTNFLRSGNLEYSIYDVQGREVYHSGKLTNILGNYKYKIETDRMLPGSYFLLLKGMIRDDSSPFVLHKAFIKQ